MPGAIQGRESENRRTIGVVTVGRSDYGHYRSILKRIQESPDLDALLYVSGSHLSPHHGNTISEIEADGHPIAARLPVLPASDSPEAIAGAMGYAVSAFGQAYAHNRPDILLVLGDRYEMMAAALAAVPLNIPIAHIHGGELSYGAIDEVFRHAMTKMAHLHFAATERAGQRIRQMGEEPWRVHVVGAPGLDDITDIESYPESDERPIVVCYHPETRNAYPVLLQVDELTATLEIFSQQIIVVGSNADSGHHDIMRGWRRLSLSHAVITPHVRRPVYLSLLSRAACLVGNSSSGIIEAASFGLPVVNIGNRQAGREHGENVIDVPCEQEAIAEGLRKALSPEFRQSLVGMKNIYGDGHASERIVKVLEEIVIDQRLIEKQFHEL